MLIRITNADCGLKAGRVYDLCSMSANTLLAKSHAVLDAPAACGGQDKLQEEAEKVKIQEPKKSKQGK